MEACTAALPSSRWNQFPELDNYQGTKTATYAEPGLGESRLQHTAYESSE